ncbi:hypothetical protein P4O66_012160 [Electrophorus voltai]|uniref:Uncharacterized protein n=1 Tax=Electrophorus voltai TaxID=2609070 RepID=A0AAD8Z6E2_9TELE|nr:hypothetical protein P4O66_012160 [Electrophorus voltai]
MSSESSEAAIAVAHSEAALVVEGCEEVRWQVFPVPALLVSRCYCSCHLVCSVAQTKAPPFHPHLKSVLQAWTGRRISVRQAQGPQQDLFSQSPASSSAALMDACLSPPLSSAERSGVQAQPAVQAPAWDQADPRPCSRPFPRLSPKQVPVPQAPSAIYVHLLNHAHLCCTVLARCCHDLLTLSLIIPSTPWHVSCPGHIDLTWGDPGRNGGRRGAVAQPWPPRGAAHLILASVGEQIETTLRRGGKRRSLREKVGEKGLAKAPAFKTGSKAAQLGPQERRDFEPRLICASPVNTQLQACPERRVILEVENILAVLPAVPQGVALQRARRAALALSQAANHSVLMAQQQVGVPTLVKENGKRKCLPLSASGFWGPNAHLKSCCFRGRTGKVRWRGYEMMSVVVRSQKLWKLSWSSTGPAACSLQVRTIEELVQGIHQAYHTFQKNISQSLYTPLQDVLSCYEDLRTATSEAALHRFLLAFKSNSVQIRRVKAHVMCVSDLALQELPFVTVVRRECVEPGDGVLRLYRSVLPRALISTSVHVGASEPGYLRRVSTTCRRRAPGPEGDARGRATSSETTKGYSTAWRNVLLTRSHRAVAVGCFCNLQPAKEFQRRLCCPRQLRAAEELVPVSQHLPWLSAGVVMLGGGLPMWSDPSTASPGYCCPLWQPRLSCELQGPLPQTKQRHRVRPEALAADGAANVPRHGTARLAKADSGPGGGAGVAAEQWEGSTKENVRKRKLPSKLSHYPPVLCTGHSELGLWEQDWRWQQPIAEKCPSDFMRARGELVPLFVSSASQACGQGHRTAKQQMSPDSHSRAHEKDPPESPIPHSSHSYCRVLYVICGTGKQPPLPNLLLLLHLSRLPALPSPDKGVAPLPRCKRPCALRQVFRERAGLVGQCLEENEVCGWIRCIWHAYSRSSILLTKTWIGDVSYKGSQLHRILWSTAILVATRYIEN